jgi:hypothetical protein
MRNQCVSTSRMYPHMGCCTLHESSKAHGDYLHKKVSIACMYDHALNCCYINVKSYGVQLRPFEQRPDSTTLL